MFAHKISWKFLAVINQGLCYDLTMKIATIDLHFDGVPHAIASFVVLGSSGVALVETGPTVSVEHCIRGLARLGLQPSDIKHVLVTHIHFDHAGAAGWWARQGAHVYVHRRGARHLIDPTILLASAEAVYGESPENIFGRIYPIPSDQLTALDDNDTITVGDLTFTALDTPGHAKHHHAFLIEDVVFTGDTAGSRLPGHRFINLTSAPPQFDPVAYDQSIARLEALNLSRLYLTHFGAVDEVADHLARFREVLWDSAEFVRTCIRNGLTLAEIVPVYTNYCHDRAIREGMTDPVWEQYNTANGFDLSAMGIYLYWQRNKDKL